MSLSQDVTVDLFVGFLLFVLWAVGAGLFTFIGPFNVTSNGYFGCWGALIATTLHMKKVFDTINHTEPPALKKAMSAVHHAAESVKAQLGGVLVCYAVVLAAALQPYCASIGAFSACGMLWESILAIIVSCVLLVFCVILLFGVHKMPENAVKALAFTMFALGFLEAFICTFRAPFVVTGNGFFGSWLGLACCLAVSVPMLPEWLKHLIHPEHGETAKVMPM